MKILLADDEKMVRLGIISMLDELYPGRHTYLETMNGKEMVQIAGGAQPDLAFVDIRMPLLDGLEAIKTVREKSPRTLFIILTGHADFSYARQALKLNVLDYLLKPVAIEDLAKSVERAAEAVEIIKTEEKRCFSHIVTQVYNGCEASEEYKGYQNARFLVYVFFTDAVRVTEKNSIRGTIYKRINSLLAERANDIRLFTLFYLNSGELCFIVNSQDDRITYAIQEVVNANQFPYTSVAGTSACGLSAAVEAIAEILSAAPLRSLFRTGAYSPVTKYTELAKDHTTHSLAALMIGLLDAVSEQNEIMYRRLVNKIAEKASYHAILNRPDSTAARFLTYVFSTEVGDGWDRIKLCLQEHVESMYRRRDKNNSVVEQIRTYINEHYMEPVSIESISDMFNLTQSYVSRLFHQQTGQKFIHYLTDVRIMNAKKLLAQSPAVTVKQTTEAVGYISVRHFTKVFKRLVGKSPSEYQKSVISDKS